MKQQIQIVLAKQTFLAKKLIQSIKNIEINTIPASDLYLADKHPD